ncbi:MAG: PIN domain-containing protein [Coriobacteriia bacterium]|nr:PIN domain-containing protein [Coriobacteriia bacterium]
MSKLSTIVIFDTNVLLTKPTVLLEYKHAEIVIPEVVLSELDKLKVARVDADLRFRGREVSRLMFDLGTDGSLIDGVDLPDGGRLRVAPFDIAGISLPDGFTTKSSDDKILATAYLLKNHASLRGNAVSDDCKVILITNDLNLLLKAQAYDIDVQQYGSGDDISFSKRYIVRPFQRYRVPLGILSLAIGVFLAVIFVAWSAGLLFWQGSTNSSPVLTTEFRALLTTEQEDAFNALETLRSNPLDASALQVIAEFYVTRTEFARGVGDDTLMMQDARRAIDYLERLLRLNPADVDARNDLAMMYFYSGNAERAVQEARTVLEEDSNNVPANLNLGMLYIYGIGVRDLDSARTQMEKVIELTSEDPTNQRALELAHQGLALITLEEENRTDAQEGSFPSPLENPTQVD